MKKISQREARELKKRCYELEGILDCQRSGWARNYPGGVHIASVHVPPEAYAIIKTARLLGHAVVVVQTENEAAMLFALPSATARD